MRLVKSVSVSIRIGQECLKERVGNVQECLPGSPD